MPGVGREKHHGRFHAGGGVARMSDAWIAFARTGNPSTAALGTWPAYERRERATMILGAETKVEKDPDATIRRLWATI